jgi:hypothetical protein
VQEEAIRIPDDDSEDEDPAAEESLNTVQLEDNSAASREGREEQKIAFVIDPQIDINSHALLDMISEEAVVVDKPLLSAHAKTVADSCEITVDEAFDDW